MFQSNFEFQGLFDPGGIPGRESLEVRVKSDNNLVWLDRFGETVFCRIDVPELSAVA